MQRFFKKVTGCYSDDSLSSYFILNGGLYTDVHCSSPKCSEREGDSEATFHRMNSTTSQLDASNGHILALKLNLQLSGSCSSISWRLFFPLLRQFICRTVFHPVIRLVSA